MTRVIVEVSFPKIRSGLDSHRGIESSHDPGDAYNPALARNVRRRLVQASEPFEQMVRAGLLPGFLEIYIERDLRLKLSRVDRDVLDPRP
jgi:hypothetical protein